MRNLPINDFWAFMCGGAVMYLFWAILDLIADKQFDVTFFFGYWSFIFLFIFLAHYLTER